MAKPLVFLGWESNIKRIYDIAVASGYEVAGLVDELQYNAYLSKTVSTIPVIGHPDTFFNDPTVIDRFDFFLSYFFKTPTILSMNANQLTWDRNRYIKTINQLNLSCVSLISPTAQISNTTKIGRGAYIGGNCVIGNYVTVGDFCQIHDNSLISNHSTIGNNTQIQRRVTFVGHTVIGDNCQIGLNTLFSNNYITVGDDAIIHSGYIIARDIAPGEIIHLTGKTLKKIYPAGRTIN